MKFVEGLLNASTSVYAPESIQVTLQLHVQTTDVHRRYLVLPVTNHFNDRPIAEHILATDGVRSSRTMLMDIQVL